MKAEQAFNIEDNRNAVTLFNNNNYYYLLYFSHYLIIIIIKYFIFHRYPEYNSVQSVDKKWNAYEQCVDFQHPTIALMFQATHVTLLISLSS